MRLDTTKSATTTRGKNSSHMADDDCEVLQASVVGAIRAVTRPSVTEEGGRDGE